MKFEAIGIVGATASGKTEIAVKLAREIRKRGVDVEFISVDSRKIYKGYNIGSAKPLSYMSEFRWHFIDEIEPNQRFSAKDFEREARKRIKEIRMRGNIPILVGGTWLYLRALEIGLFDEGENGYNGYNGHIRSYLQERLRTEGKESIIELLKRIDPLAFSKIHPNDVYRMIRAIEIKMKTGKSIAELRFGDLVFPIAKLGVVRSKENLRERIKERVLKQINMGLLDEIKLIVEKYGEDTHVIRSIAGLEPYLYLKGKLSFDDMVKTMISRNWRYARYQMKVFSREGTVWFGDENISTLISFAIKLAFSFFQ